MQKRLDMETNANRLVEMDANEFDPWRVQPVSHRLTEHPLLQPDRLIEFGKRLERADQLYSFNNGATAAENFDKVGQTHPNRKSAEETLQHINDAKAWMLLRHVQNDAEYRTLVDLALDHVRPQIERKDPGMCYRAGWIFVSSPRTVTPFHIDRNHGILLQIRGSKTVYVWEPDDIAVVNDRARARFHARRTLDLVHWHEEFRERAHVFRLQPGMGVYMPLTSPHMVETSNEPSITLSLSYNTDASRRNVLLHVAHDRIRSIGIRSPPVGRYPTYDAWLHASASAMRNCRGVLRSVVGRTSFTDNAAYAVDRGQ